MREMRAVAVRDVLKKVFEFFFQKFQMQIFFNFFFVFLFCVSQLKNTKQLIGANNG